MQPDITWTDAAGLFGFCAVLFGGFWLMDVLHGIGNRIPDYTTPPDLGDDLLPPLRVPPPCEMTKLLRLRHLDRRFRARRR
jgi:hypothetical protein